MFCGFCIVEVYVISLFICCRFGASVIDLYWSLYGNIELDVLVLPAQYSVAESVGTALFLLYHIAAVLVLLNALIGMLSNTYNLVEVRVTCLTSFEQVWVGILSFRCSLNVIPKRSVDRLVKKGE